jgi:hypothetical protein
MIGARSLAAALPLAVAAALSCNPATRVEGPGGDGPARRPHEVTLRLGESVQLESPLVRVTFVALSDSRCPRNVVCITAGAAGAELVAAGRGRSERFRLDMVGDETPPTAPTSQVLGHDFRMMRLDPYPTYGVDVPDADRVLTLYVR